MMLHLLKGHLEGRRVSSSSMAAASGVPYATAMRKLADLQKAGLVEQRPRTKSGRSFSLHPSAALLERFGQLSSRISRIAREIFGEAEADVDDYFYGGSYVTGQAAIAPPTALLSPLTLGGGLRILVHGDPTFMVMENLKRQFEHIVGTDIHQRAFSIDRLRQEILRNAQRKHSAYDLIAVDLPWLGEFVTKGVIHPLPDIMDTDRLDPAISTPPAGARPTGTACPMACPARPRPNFCSIERTGSRARELRRRRPARTRSRRPGISTNRAGSLRRGVERGARHGAGAIPS
jgi:multiple sugar transport system substrate-binding protein